MRVRITFVEEVLGTASANPEMHAEYIASKAPSAKARTEEIEDLSLEEMIEKHMTVFPKDNGIPFFYDYQWKGFFKDSCSALSRCGGTESSKVKAYKKIIDGCIFVLPRKILVTLSSTMGTCQRPLRANTAQGERVALASSETIPAGSTCEFEIVCLDHKFDSLVKEWLEYGRLKGTGQWRNSGKGRFTVEYLSLK